MRVAKEHVNTFEVEGGLMGQHLQAMECRDCESFLQLGIDAFDWLNRADEEVRKLIYAGKIQYDKEFDEALLFMYQRWLHTCEFAKQLIKSQQERGFQIDNLGAFLSREREIAAIVKASKKVSGPLLALRDEAISEHHSGQTSEWPTS